MNPASPVSGALSISEDMGRVPPTAGGRDLARNAASRNCPKTRCARPRAEAWRRAPNAYRAQEGSRVFSEGSDAVHVAERWRTCGRQWPNPFASPTIRRITSRKLVVTKGCFSVVGPAVLSVPKNLFNEWKSTHQWAIRLRGRSATSYTDSRIRVTPIRSFFAKTSLCITLV